MNHIKEQQELIKSQISNSYNNLEKGGEGSRGGKIIGHTSTGKPIYKTHSNDPRSRVEELHDDFTPTEHREAKVLHRKLKNEGEKKGDFSDWHNHNHGEWAHNSLHHDKGVVEAGGMITYPSGRPMHGSDINYKVMLDRDENGKLKPLKTRAIPV